MHSGIWHPTGCCTLIWWFQGASLFNNFDQHEWCHRESLLHLFVTWFSCLQRCRCVLIMLISIAMHCVFLCEQRAGSADVFPNHPRLSWLCNCVAYAPHQRQVLVLVLGKYVATSIALIPLTRGSAEVYRGSFWMLHHGAKSPKRTTVWSLRKSLVTGLVSAPNMRCLREQSDLYKSPIAS